MTLSTLRARYWVLQGRKTVRSVLHHCVACARLRADVGQQLMGSLPAPRVVRPPRAFTYTGVDYAGPLSVRVAGGRGHKSHPAYIALFVCLSVKAIHLEVVSDYSSAAFLAAFRRFCARRGLPAHMYSDRGTTFQGADRELTQAFRTAIEDPSLRAQLANDFVTWHFIPPAAPHFGGLWEAGVRSVKTHLKRVLLGHAPTFEELNTLTAQIEACLNSRPLGPVTDDVIDLQALSPAHFLVGGPMAAVPAPPLLDVSISPSARWRLFQQLLERFWRLWSSDYLQSLQRRSKWQTERSPVAVGQLVLLKQDASPPAKWPLGRVTAVHPGDDGLVRVVTVRTAVSTYVRPITKIVLLPVSHDPTDHGVRPDRTA